MAGDDAEGRASTTPSDASTTPSDAAGPTRAGAGRRVMGYDALKTFAIFLVCLYHYNQFQLEASPGDGPAWYVNYFFHGTASMAVPLFFMVNGALLLNRSFVLRKHLRKTLYLYGLFFAWCLISYTAFCFIWGTRFSLRGLAGSCFHLTLGVNNHLWFLSALVCVYLLFPFVKLIYDQVDRSLLWLLCAIVFTFSFGDHLLDLVLNLSKVATGAKPHLDPVDFFPLVNPFGNYFYALLYFIAGGLLAEHIRSGRRTPRVSVLVAVLVGCMSMLFGYGVLMTDKAHTFYDTVWNGSATVMALAMSVATFLLFLKPGYDHPRVNRWLALIGTNTLGIYVIHRFIGAITTPYFRRVPFAATLPVNAVYAAGILLVSLAIVLPLKKVPGVKRLFIV